MRELRRGARERGFSIIEVMISAGILAIVAAAALLFLTTEWRHESMNRDRQFAHDRAQSILEELRAFAEVGEDQDAATLDQFDDGIGHSFTLSTLHKASPDGAQLVDPDAPVSANSRTSDGRWRYARRITVRHFPGVDQRDLRIVTVRVFLNANSTAPPGAEIANCSSVIRTVADATPPTQVYDVYFVAIENVPGWWVYMDTIRPFVEASLTDLVGRNPGLKFRTHWITKLGYGRDPQYTPYFNDSTPSTDPIAYAYFYPGLMPSASASQRYYVAANVKGRANVDGLIKNGYDATTNPTPYAIADQHNNCLRLPEEEALFAARVASGQEKDTEPTWRLLLERMNSNPDAYRNAVIVNLHGELLPLPPVRNYSDAAKEPETRPGVRVVTHPEKIRFTRDPANVASEDVRLRVYTYRTDPSVLPERLDAPVIVEIPGFDLTANVNGTGFGATTLGIGRISGGLDLNPVDSSRDAYVYDASPVELGNGAHTVAFPGEMYSRVYYSSTAYGGAGATVIELHSSPLTAPAVINQGLDVSARLYGMEYIPCPVEAAKDFSRNLASGATLEKNSARWTIRIPVAMLGGADRRLEVVTRIGHGNGGNLAPDNAAFSTGIMYPPASRVEPENISKTYCWWAATTDVVPATERYQFLGDPRHCPYADLGAGGTSFPNGYNWYFDDLENGTNMIAYWPALDASRIKNDATATNDGWKGRISSDVPRLFQLVREGLQKSEALFTTLTGFSYYYYGLGNEIGYDAANGYPSSIPVSGQPFGAGGSTGFEQSILGSGGTWGSGGKLIRSGAGGNYWWEMPWLGELYPDSVYTTAWKVPVGEDASATAGARMGNLPAGSGNGNFMRVSRSTINVNLPTGTTFRPTERRTAAEGCTSMFNCGTAASTFHHQSQDGTSGAIADGGTEVGRDFHFPLPASARISRPFRVASNADGGIGDEFNFTTEYPKATATVRRTYYGHSTGATGSGLVELSTPGMPHSAFVVVSGIDRTTESGSSFIARFAMLTLIHGLLSAGDPALPAPIGLPPRITILAPTAITELADPAQINVTWRTEWRRWDGLAYTTTFPNGYVRSDSNVQYVLIYSSDNGVTWKHVQDNSAAIPGVLPAAGLRVNDAVDGGDETYAWATPAGSFPVGTYRLRVEAYRTGALLHYSFHEERIYINR